MCYLIHEDQTLAEEDRKLFGTLANRMILKAAQSVPSDRVSRRTYCYLVALIDSCRPSPRQRT